MEFLEDAFGPNGALAVKFVVALIVVLLLISIVTWIMRRVSGTHLGPVGRNRQPRLQIMDATIIDGRRKLVLVRRDDVEHLILIGGGADVVVEQTIIKGAPAGYMPRRPGPAKRPRPPKDGHRRPEQPAPATAPPAATSTQAARPSPSAPAPAAGPLTTEPQRTNPVGSSKQPQRAPSRPGPVPAPQPAAPAPAKSGRDLIGGLTQRFGNAFSRGSRTKDAPAAAPPASQTTDAAAQRNGASSGFEQTASPFADESPKPAAIPASALGGSDLERELTAAVEADAELTSASSPSEPFDRSGIRDLLDSSSSSDTRSGSTVERDISASFGGGELESDIEPAKPAAAKPPIQSSRPGLSSIPRSDTTVDAPPSTTPTPRITELPTVGKPEPSESKTQRPELLAPETSTEKASSMEDEMAKLLGEIAGDRKAGS